MPDPDFVFRLELFQRQTVKVVCGFLFFFIIIFILFFLLPCQVFSYFEQIVTFLTNDDGA